MEPIAQALLVTLPQDARRAIEQAVTRVTRQEDAQDVEGMIGASKDLAETVAKSIIGGLGGTYGSDADMPKLAGKVLEVLERHPAGLRDQPLLRTLSQSLTRVLHALADLRNRHGTGHGRPNPSELALSDAVLAVDSASAWCRWALAASTRVIAGRQEVAQAVHQISHDTLRRGRLTQMLQDLQLNSSILAINVNSAWPSPDAGA